MAGQTDDNVVFFGGTSGKQVGNSPKMMSMKRLLESTEIELLRIPERAVMVHARHNFAISDFFIISVVKVLEIK